MSKFWKKKAKEAAELKYKPGEVLVSLSRDLNACLNEMRGARKLGDAIQALATEQPEKYGDLVQVLEAKLKELAVPAAAVESANG